MFENFIRPNAALAQSASDGLLVDVFAGFGGASIASERAHGRPVDIAINHSPMAIRYHERNHPAPTVHFTTDVWEIEPLTATQGRSVFHAHFSPDCTHFSQARGGKPVRQKVRSLAWVVVKWAKQVRPQLITLENVREFLTWGPLTTESKPDPSRKGQTFRRWKSQLEKLGYVIEWRVLDAADYGAPTHRRRLFIVARCDGQAIVWPEPTHGIESMRTGAAATEKKQSSTARENRNKRRDAREPLGGRSVPHALLHYRTAAECIDWSIPAPSIYLTKEQARDLGLRVIRPLARKTLWRIAMGIKRYVIEAAAPYLVRVAHGDISANGQKRLGDTSHSVNDPLPTLTGSKDFAVVTAAIAKYYGQGDGQTIGEPLHTVTTKDRFGLVPAYLVRANHGGDEFRGQTMDKPLGTVTSHHGYGVVAPSLIECANSTWSDGFKPADEPLPTITANPKGGSWALMAAHLSHYHDPKGGETRASSLNEPIPTADTSNRFSLVAACLVKFFGTSISADIIKPLSTITANAGGGHLGLIHARLSLGVSQDDLARFWRVYAFLVENLGPTAPLPFVQVDGQLYLIVDIGMRMLEPRELLRAQFTPEIAAGIVLPENKSLAVRLIGNSVSPPPLQALLMANLPPRKKLKESA